MPAAEVTYARGADLVENRQGSAGGAADPVTVSAAVGGLDFRWARLNPTTELVNQGQMTRVQGLGKVRWTGQVVAPVTMRYELTVAADDGFRLDVAGQRVLDEWAPTPRARACSAMRDVEAGKAYDVKLEYFENIRDAEVRLNWRQPGAKEPFAEAMDAAKAADVVTFYRSVNDLPPFADYSMKNRTYKYLTGQALYPFGHGLSYMRFDYSGMRVEPASGEYELAAGRSSADLPNSVRVRVP